MEPAEFSPFSSLVILQAESGPAPEHTTPEPQQQCNILPQTLILPVPACLFGLKMYSTFTAQKIPSDLLTLKYFF